MSLLHNTHLKLKMPAFFFCMKKSSHLNPVFLQDRGWKYYHSNYRLTYKKVKFI